MLASVTLLPPSLLISGYVAGLVLLLFLILAARKGLSGDIGSLQLLLGLSGAFFAVLAIASGVQYWFAGAESVWDKAGWFFGGVAFLTFAAMRTLGGLSRSAGTAISNPADGSSAARPMVSARVQLVRKGQIPWSGVQVQRTAVIDWKGELNAQTVGELTRRIENACAAGPLTLLVDLSEVTSLDAAGAEGLVDCSRRHPEAHLSIVAPDGSPAQQALKQLGIDQTIAIRPGLPFSNEIADAIKRAEATATAPPASDVDAAPPDPNRWKGF